MRTYSLLSIQLLSVLRDRRRFLALGLSALACLSALGWQITRSSHAHAAHRDAPTPATTFNTIIVNTTSDHNGTVTTCSLREAIISANTNTAFGGCTAGSPGLDTIVFNLSVIVPPTISVGSTGAGPLPDITEPVVIDGSSSGRVELNGAAAGNFVDGLRLSLFSGGSTFRSLVINRFNGTAIRLTDSSNNSVQNCYLGIDATGSIAQSNAQYGIHISGGGSNVIGGTATSARNVISNGIYLESTSNNQVLGNYFGTDASGTTAVGNAGSVSVGGLSTSSNNLIGGTSPGARNVISGNSNRGVYLGSAAVGNRVLGNYIGTSADGLTALGNGGAGVLIESGQNNEIGGTEPGAGNLISGNAQSGIHVVSIVGPAASGNRIEGNRIGTNATGTSALPNATVGVSILGALNTTIGGTVAGAGNLISGNGTFGVYVRNQGSYAATGNRLEGNLIGTDASGTAALANGQDGVRIESNGNFVGGTTAGARNIISGNTQHGIFLAGELATDNQIQGNYIGTTSDGLSALGNGLDGIPIVNGANNLIGGTAAGAGNVIAGNGRYGVLLQGGLAIGNRLEGNYIGLKADGLSALAPIVFGSYGIEISGAAQNTIGGTTAAARNVIGGNNIGVNIGNGSNNNFVQGNYVGTDFTGQTAVPNTVGVFVSNAPANVIGGAAAGAGNVIAGNDNHGVFFLGATASGNSLAGNLIGLKADGLSALGNGSGVEVLSAPATVIGGAGAGARNIISGNTNNGVAINGATATGNKIEGNYIGTNASGTAAIANGQNGVRIGSSNNTVGGTTVGARNVIAGNGDSGVSISGIDAAQGNRIEGNFIGTNASGTAAIPNAGTGVVINANNCAIGSTVAGAGNLISGNGTGGVSLVLGSSGNTIEGNFIGTDINGTAAIPNLGNGVSIVTGANTVGGLSASARNIIAGNTGHGVAITFLEQQISIDGNYIGVQADGQTALGNALDGIFIARPPVSSPQLFCRANTIAFNGRNGITAVGTNGNSRLFFTNNSIYSNGALGIDLAPEDGLGNPFFGVNPNDPGDGDSGPNGLMNFPVLTKAVAYTAGANTFVRVQGSLDTNNAGANTIQLFVNPACDASGHGEGKTLLAQFDVTIPAGGGVVNFNQLLNVAGSIPLNAGDAVTATATPPAGGGTSEFSACIPLLAPTLAINDISVTEGNSGQTAATFTVTLTGAIGAIDPVTVNYATANGTATAASDYVIANGTVTFNPPFNQNTITQTITVQVLGDTTVESNENFFVNLTGNSGATLIDSQGFATIVDDDTNCPTITISPATLPNGQLGTMYDQQLTASGGSAPYTFNLTNGSLPNGVTLSSAGLISGTPTAAGNFPITVQATANNACVGHQSYTLVIGACPTITITPATLPNGTDGTTYNQSLTANGGTPGYSYSITAGALPNGLSLSTSGALTGTPTTPGTFNFTAQALDANNCTGTRAYSIIINPTTMAGLQYYPLPRPIRLLDTRAGQPACVNPGVELAGGGIRTQNARLTCDGITIPANAEAIVGNATVVNFTSSGGYVTLWPNGQPQPTVSNLNYTENHIVPNAFTVALGNDGAFNIFNTTTVHFIVDVTGYFAPPASDGLYFHPLPRPIRLLDTRTGEPACVNPSAPLNGGGTRTQNARVTCNGVTIPAAAQAITGNATAVNFISEGGFITLWPNGQAQPTVSNLNYTANHIVPNAFTVTLGNDGAFNIFNTSTTHFIVDVAGYYSTEASDVNGQGLLYNPLGRPIRLLDTRAGQPACVNPGAQLTENVTRTQNARLTCDGQTIPANAQAIYGNATVVNFTSPGGFVTLWPDGQALPTVSNLNYTSNHIVPNAFIVGLGASGAFNIRAITSIHFIVDVAGYFAP